MKAITLASHSPSLSQPPNFAPLSMGAPLATSKIPVSKIRILPNFLTRIRTFPSLCKLDATFKSSSSRCQFRRDCEACPCED